MFVEIPMYQTKDSDQHSQPMALNLALVVTVTKSPEDDATCVVRMVTGKLLSLSLPYSEVMAMIARHNRPWTSQDAAPEAVGVPTTHDHQTDANLCAASLRSGPPLDYSTNYHLRMRRVAADVALGKQVSAALREEARQYLENLMHEADVSKDSTNIDTFEQPVRASSTFVGDSFSPPPAARKEWEKNAYHARMRRLKKQIDEGYAVRSYEVEEVRQYVESLDKGEV